MSFLSGIRCPGEKRAESSGAKMVLGRDIPEPIIGNEATRFLRIFPEIPPFPVRRNTGTHQNTGTH